MTAEELLKRYAAGDRMFAGTKIWVEEYAGILCDKNLKGVNLCGSTLEGDWSGVILVEARLCGIVMLGSDCQRADLTKADLAGAIFTQCDLTECNFTDAILSGIAFKQTEVCSSNFTRADMRGAFLTETGFTSANLTGTDLLGAEGVSADDLQREGCILSNTRMPDGSLYIGEK